MTALPIITEGAPEEPGILKGSLCQTHDGQLRAALEALGVPAMVLTEETTPAMIEHDSWAHAFRYIASNYLQLYARLSLTGQIAAQVATELLPPVLPPPAPRATCVICVLTLTHKVTCHDPACTVSYDRWLQQAAQDVRADYDAALKAHPPS